MGIFNKQRDDGYTYDGQGEERQGMIDVIKYNGEADELVWKFPYENLSVGAQLIVNQSQEAIFYKGGAACDVFGAGTHTLSANNIPVLQKLVNLPFGGKTPFTAEVWYVNKIVRRNLKFGTPVPIDLLDPLYNVSVPVRSFGEYGIQIADSSAFITQMVGTLHLTTTEEIIEQFKSFVTRKLSTCISKYVLQKEISVVKIGAHLDDISVFVRAAVGEEFEQYGIRVTNFDVASINFDKDDPNVQKILDSQSEAAKRRMEGYTYQQERQLDVMETAAGNEGGAGQMMGAGMGLGMGFGVGGAFGQQMGNMAGVMNAQPVQPQQAATVPPPPPTATVWHVLINNAQQQCNEQTLAQQVQSGQVTRETYVWKAGMAQWAKAGDCPELQNLFGNVPPPPIAP
jgi:membrane protease subunit (stomatin/prohibitin family)